MNDDPRVIRHTFVSQGGLLFRHDEISDAWLEVNKSNVLTSKAAAKILMNAQFRTRLTRKLKGLCVPKETDSTRTEPD